MRPDGFFKKILIKIPHSRGVAEGRGVNCGSEKLSFKFKIFFEPRPRYRIRHLPARPVNPLRHAR